MVKLAEWNGGSLPSISGSSITSAVGSGLLDQHLLVQHNGQAATYAEWTFSAASTISIRYYIELPSSWPASSHAIATLKNGAPSVVGRFPSLAGTSAPGSLRLVDTAGDQLSTSGSGTVNNSTLYRVEAQVNHASNQARMAVWSAGDTAALWDSGWQGGNFLSQTDRVQIGATTGASPQLGSFKIAHVLVTDEIGDWLGEHQPVEGEVKVAVWDGTRLIPVVGVV